MMGGPPCQGYSGMNRFNKGNWSMVQNSMVRAGVRGRGRGRVPEQPGPCAAAAGRGQHRARAAHHAAGQHAPPPPQAVGGLSAAAHAGAPHPRPHLTSAPLPCPPVGHGVPQLLRLLPPPLLPAGERAQLCEPQQELHVPPHAAHAAGHGLPGAARLRARATAARARLLQAVSQRARARAGPGRAPPTHRALHPHNHDTCFNNTARAGAVWRAQRGQLRRAAVAQAHHHLGRRAQRDPAPVAQDQARVPLAAGARAAQRGARWRCVCRTRRGGQQGGGASEASRAPPALRPCCSRAPPPSPPTRPPPPPPHTHTHRS